MAEALEGYDAIEGAGVTVRATDALMFCKTRKASEFRAVWSMETEAATDYVASEDQNEMVSVMSPGM